MSRNTILIGVIVLTGKVFAQSGYDGISDKDYTTQRYTDTTIGGWKVKVNTHLTEEHRAIMTTGEDFLQKELKAIEKRLPDEAIADLKQIPIWLEYGTPDNQSLQYHVSAKWLAMNYYDLRKENAIEIVIPDYAAMSHDSLPLIRMFAYGYLHKVPGKVSGDIKTTFENAVAEKIYLPSDGSAQTLPFKNNIDYFVSLSTAYFTDIAYPPYNRKKLKQMDPKGYELVEKLWKVKG